MCRRVVCPSCRKATYEGCGGHVEQVLAGVPSAQRCACERTRPGAAQAPRPGVPQSSRWARLKAWMKSTA